MELLELDDEIIPEGRTIEDRAAHITSDFYIFRVYEDEYNTLSAMSALSNDALYIITDQQLNAHNKKVINVADPEDPTDGANKHYIDSSISTIINTNISTELVNTSNNVSANGIYINDNQQKRAALLQLEAYSTNTSNGQRAGDTLYKMVVNRGFDVDNFVGNNEAVLGVGLHALKNGNQITSYQGFTVCPHPLSNSNTDEIATTQWITDRIASLINVLTSNI